MSQKLIDSKFPWCPADAKSGEFYNLRVDDLSPMQFAVGKAEVAVRAGRMRKKHHSDPSKLHAYLRVRPIPIVVRRKKFYLVEVPGWWTGRKRRNRSDCYAGGVDNRGPTQRRRIEAGRFTA